MVDSIIYLLNKEILIISPILKGRPKKQKKKKKKTIKKRETEISGRESLFRICLETVYLLKIENLLLKTL